MWWLPVIALLLVGQAAKAEEAPPPSRFDSITKGANDLWQGLPGLSMPPWSIPSIPMPGMPDFSMPDLMKEFDAFTQQVSDSLPLLEEMGYEVASFRVQWGLPPKARLRLRSKGTIEASKLALTTEKAKGGVLMTALISSAASAKRIQSTMKLGTAILDVDFAIPPKVRMSFLKSVGDKTQINDRDPEEFALACRDAGLDN